MNRNFAIRIGVWCTLSAFVLGTLGAFLPANSQQRQMVCSKRDGLIERLYKSHEEIPFAKGTEGKPIRFVLEILLNPETGTWTVLRSLPNGVSCFVAVGDNWEFIPVEIPEPDAEDS